MLHVSILTWYGHAEITWDRHETTCMFAKKTSQSEKLIGKYDLWSKDLWPPHVKTLRASSMFSSTMSTPMTWNVKCEETSTCFMFDQKGVLEPSLDFACNLRSCKQGALSQQWAAHKPMVPMPQKMSNKISDPFGRTVGQAPMVWNKR